jgi:hypothetical protein
MFRSFVICVSAFALFPGVGTTPAAAAQADRRVDCNVAINNDALVVQRVAVGNTPVPCYWSAGKDRKYQPPPEFQAGDDWLQDLSITFFNRTDKTIVYVLIGLSFPQTQPERATNISLGRIPDVAAFDYQGKPVPQGARQPLSIGPGQSLTLKVGDYIQEIRGGLEPVLFVPVTTVTIHLISCHFEDGMYWNPSSYSIPAPQHPGQWQHMPSGYFPGDKNANWPPTAISPER